jgi:outer membrane lipoprotein LolB
VVVRVLAVAAVLWLGACARMPAPERAWTPPAADDWTLDGRIAVQSGGEGWHASLRWVQTGAAFRIELSGPLGQGAVRLQGDADGVSLERADGLRDRAADAAELLERHTGWVLPVDGLRFWVRGLAVPERPARWAYDAAGRPLRLQQDGWDIRYAAYQEPPADAGLPRRIELVRDGLQARLIIDRWAAGDPG